MSPGEVTIIILDIVQIVFQAGIIFGIACVVFSLWYKGHEPRDNAEE